MRYVEELDICLDGCGQIVSGSTYPHANGSEVCLRQLKKDEAVCRKPTEDGLPPGSVSN